MNKNEIIQANNITLNYDGLTVVKDINFSVEKGDYLCIIGDNGTGKSTLLRAILGLKKISSGSIHFNGFKRNDIGYLAQQTDVQKDFPASVWEVVLSGCLNKKRFLSFYTKRDKERADNAFYK